MAFSLSLLALCFLTTPAGAQSKTSDYTDFWPEADLWMQLAENTRLLFLVKSDRDEVDGSGSDISSIQMGGEVELGLLPFARDFVARSRYDSERLKFLRLLTGVRYVIYPGEDGAQTTSEWRIVAAAIPRAYFPLELTLAFRNQVDLRWVEGSFSWRYRPRLTLEREFRLGSHALALVPFGSAEAFWDSSVQSWYRERYRLGTAVPITRWFASKVYWALQRDESDDGDTVTNALGVTVELYF